MLVFTNVATLFSFLKGTTHLPLLIVSLCKSQVLNLQRFQCLTLASNGLSIPTLFTA